MQKIIGNIITEKESFHGTVSWDGDSICSLTKKGAPIDGEPFVLAGFIDVHLHDFRI